MRSCRFQSCGGVGCEGFTLLELIIAISLVAVITLITSGALRIGYRSIEKGEGKIEKIERFRASLSIIDGQIQSITPLSIDKDGNKEFYFTGARDSLTMTTNYSIWGGQRGFVLVTYRVEADEQGRRNLFAEERMVGMEKNKEVFLFKGVEKISFEYYFKDATKEEGEWKEEWTDTTTIPQKIRLHLTADNREILLIMPIRAYQGRS